MSNSENRRQERIRDTEQRIAELGQFMKDVLVAIAGAVCTPEKGYEADGGLQLLLHDIKALRKQHDAHAEECQWIRKKLNLPADAQFVRGMGQTLAGSMHVVCDHAHGYMTYIKAYRCNDKQGEIARLTVQLATIRRKLEEIVCTLEPDKGVVMLSYEGPTHYDAELGCQVYDHENFSPLGDALIELHDLTTPAAINTEAVPAP